MIGNQFTAGYNIKLHYCNLIKMVHSGGFEPPTARFVAEYSIQLSYECTEGAHYKFVIFPVKLFESMI